MDKKRLESLVQKAYEQANNVLLVNHDKSLCPLWLMITDQDEGLVMGTPWRNDEDKMLTEAMMRIVFKINKVVAYSVVTEAWMATYEDIPKSPNARPSKSPGRKEIVIAFATDGVNQVFRNWEIKRNHLEQITALAEMRPLDENGPPESWMLGLLDTEIADDNIRSN